MPLITPCDNIGEEWDCSRTHHSRIAMVAAHLAAVLVPCAGEVAHLTPTVILHHSEHFPVSKVLPRFCPSDSGLVSHSLDSDQGSVCGASDASPTSSLSDSADPHLPSSGDSIVPLSNEASASIHIDPSTRTKYELKGNPAPSQRWRDH
ncbi:hypothetical protein NDU88_003463 [Pleurodeles waltl]|uniref:Uncharacterized protein n=1 Tax=Pleurodeles waltl TaxID=8319 RepID=A0AAV7VG67_PLEWA|nr:hypothetical protein NDU88_003463 [Pleurodeles waltl]